MKSTLGHVKNSAPPISHVAIIGGGAAGVSAALHLLQEARLAGGSITIVEPNPALGLGVAYAATDVTHRLNVAAARMTMLEDEPLDFAEWLIKDGELTSDPGIAAADGAWYPIRAAFGRYLGARLRAQIAACPTIRFHHVADRATSLHQTPQGHTVGLAGGSAVVADAVILATGHASPGLPSPIAHLADDDRVVVDPWKPDALANIAPGARVLIVGTGLSMADVVATLGARGHRGQIAAMSRRGLLSRRREPAEAYQLPDLARQMPVSGTLRSIRLSVRAAAKQGLHWTAVFETLRQINSTIWRGWSPAERRRFLRHLRPYWDVHRFQVAPQTFAAVEKVRIAGGLALRAGSLLAGRPTSDGIVIRYRLRGSANLREELFDAVVNCTGTAYGAALMSNPLLKSMLDSGLIRADPFGLGLDVDDAGRALRADGSANQHLYVLGAPARGGLGEVTGAPEIAQHARLVARQICE